MSSYTIGDFPESERPRERLREKGVEALTDAELLALVIRSGSGKGNVLELSREILSEFGLGRLGGASINELKQFDGVGEVKAGQVLAVSELSRRLATRHGKEKRGKIRSFGDAVPHLKEMAGFDDERIGVICLDASNTVLSIELDLLRGSVDRVKVETRTIVREAVRQRASGVILAHNHPSGDSRPSEKDVEVTTEVEEALETVGVKLLDHVVVGKECRSLRKDGHL